MSLLDGKDVFVCDCEEEKFKIVDKLFVEGNEAVCVCPYLDIEYEYRTIFLDGEVIYIYKKQKPFVVGDGYLNIRELINRDFKYFEVSMENLDFNYIPKKDEKVIVGWKHNLGNGAIPIVIDENDLYYSDVKKIALETGRVMELKYAAIDIAVSPNEVLVMEVNAKNIGITKFCDMVPNGFEIGKKIYSKVIDKMFEGG